MAIKGVICKFFEVYNLSYMNIPDMSMNVYSKVLSEFFFTVTQCKYPRKLICL